MTRKKGIKSISKVIVNRLKLIFNIFKYGRNILIAILNIFLLNLNHLKNIVIAFLNYSKFLLSKKLVYFFKIFVILIKSLILISIGLINFQVFNLKKLLLIIKSFLFEIRDLFNIIRSFKQFETLSIFLKSKIFIIYYFVKHIKNYLIFGGFKKRLSYHRNLKKVISYLQNEDIGRLAIFLGHHQPNKLPLSNQKYIKSLINCGFKIIYLHNGNLNINIIEELENLNCQVICRLNLGHDIGACKDINLLIDNLEISMKIDWLLWCNDSNYFLGGKNTEIFEKKLMNCLSNNQADIITMWESKSVKSHCQSYFLCFESKVINSKIYKKFWNDYLPLSYRSHAIYNGEIALSQHVLNRFNIQTIYNTKSIYKNILNNKNYKSFENIFKHLPNSVCSNLNFRKRYFLIDKEKLQLLIDELEAYNPSHMYAFLNIVADESPFLKKDIVKAKSFSYSSAENFIMNYFDYDIDNELAKEIINSLKLSQKFNTRKSLRFISKN